MSRQMGRGRDPLLAMMANVWGMAVVVGPTLVLDIYTAASTLAVVSGWVFRRREGLPRLLRPLVILGAALPWAYMLLIRPWLLKWGATEEEVEKPLPGDELVPEPRHQSTRAITVNAPVEEVWPWLAQVGQDRGGFYSYEWLENLSGAYIRSADRIRPEWQHREEGDVVRTSPSFGFKVEAFEPGKAMVLEHWGAFCVEPIGEKSTRVILRTRAPRGLGGVFYHPLVGEFPHFVMERGMLKGKSGEQNEQRGPHVPRNTRRRKSGVGTDYPGDEPFADLKGEEEPLASLCSRVLAQRRRLGRLLSLLDRPDRPDSPGPLP